MEKAVIKKGRKRLELKQLEVEALSFLENQRALTLTQYYEFCYYVLDYDITEYAFKNRIRKLEEFKIVRAKNFVDGFEGERFKYISVGAAGVDLLIQTKRLPTDYNKRKIYTFLEKENLYHYFATQQVVIDFYRRIKMFYKRDMSNIIKSLIPSQSPYKMWVSYKKLTNNTSRIPGLSRFQAVEKKTQPYNKPTGEYVPCVVADWILHAEKKEENTILMKTAHIELDTGSESLDELEYKVLRYLNLAESNPNATIAVFFILPDETYLAGKKFGNRDKRVENIRKHFSNNPKLIKRIKESNLLVCVYPLRKADIALGYFFFNRILA
ncbi:hypothetical protein [Bacillus sp. FJAT-52991]|uniref:Replication-relaxation n=1 Tax=Bacillus kandeliae TaxID=3129297 RepID=A0ABZ2NCI1_9BACI